MIIRGIYKIYRIVWGVSDWFRYKVTPRGKWFLGIMGIVALVGLDVTQSIAYQAFLIMLALLITSIVVSRILSVPYKFRFYRILPRYGTVGVPLKYKLVIDWEGKVISSACVQELDLVAKPSFDEFNAEVQAEERYMKSFRVSRKPFRRTRLLAKWKAQETPELAPGRQIEVKMELLPLRRGILRLNRIGLGLVDPFGLVYSMKKAVNPQSVIILPERYPIPDFSLSGAARYQRGGVAQAMSVGQADEFVSLREYMAGDPIRHIHWRSWAKVGKPIVREFTDEYFVRHALILDTFTPELYSRVFETAVSVAASFACTLQTQESLLDLLFVGTEAFCFTSGRGLAHTEQMLEILASVEPCRNKSFDSLTALVMNHISVVSGCVIILIDWDEKRRELVDRLHRLGVEMYIIVVVEPKQKQQVQASTGSGRPYKLFIIECDRVKESLAMIK